MTLFKALMVSLAIWSKVVLCQDKSCNGTFAFRSGYYEYPQSVVEDSIAKSLKPCGLIADSFISYSDACGGSNDVKLCRTWDGNYTVTIDNVCGCFKGDTSGTTKEYVVYVRGI